MRTFLLWLIIAWLLGIALGVGGVGWPVVLALAVVVGLFIRRMRFHLAIAVTGVCLIGLGWVWGSSVSRLELETDCNFDEESVFVVVEEPVIKTGSVQLVVENVDNRCRVLVNAFRFSEIREGEEVQLSGGRWQSLDEVSEFSAGYADYLRRREIGGTLSFGDVDSLSINRERGLGSLHEVVRGLVTQVFVEPDASVVLAVLLAEKGTLPEELVGQFRMTGVSHVLAISGMHITLVATMLLLVLLLLPISPWVRTILLLLLLWPYVLFIGAPASALRAVIFWTIALVGLRLNLLISLPTIFWLAVAILVSFNPLLLLEVGFQLSISAVAGIFMALFLMRKPRHFFINSLFVSLGAWLATAPLIAYHFGNISLLGVVTNLLVVPVVPILLLAAILALLLSLIAMPLALLAAWVFHAILTWISFVTDLMAKIPGVFLEEVNVSLKLVFVYYLVLIAVVGLILYGQKRNWREIWAP